MSWIALMVFGYGSYFAAYSASSFVYLGEFGASRQSYGLVLAGGSVAYLLGTLFCRRWLSVHGVRSTVAQASVFTGLSVLMFVVPVFCGGHGLGTQSVALWLHLVGYGVRQPCAQVGMAGPFPLQAGAAAALGGCVLDVGAALCSVWIGSAFDVSSRSIGLAIGALVAACGAIALTSVQRCGADPAVRTAGAG